MAACLDAFVVDADAVAVVVVVVGRYHYRKVACLDASVASVVVRFFVSWRGQAKKAVAAAAFVAAFVVVLVMALAAVVAD